MDAYTWAKARKNAGTDDGHPGGKQRGKGGNLKKKDERKPSLEKKLYEKHRERQRLSKQKWEQQENHQLETLRRQLDEEMLMPSVTYSGLMPMGIATKQQHHIATAVPLAGLVSRTDIQGIALGLDKRGSDASSYAEVIDEQSIVNVEYKDENEDTGNASATPPRKRTASDQKRSSSEGGDLTPSSVGSNVRVLWKGKELVRLHYAALHVPWSVVPGLRDAAQTSTKTGFMDVELSQMENKQGERTFCEDFPKVFGHVFRDVFVPLVHEQFNMKGDCPEDLPSEIEQAFNLLVLAERLKAKLKSDIFRHMCELIEKNAVVTSPIRSLAYRLIKASLEFSKPAAEGTFQATIVENAVKSLVDALPVSLPALENLVELSSIKARPDMAVQLFHHSTVQTLTMSQQESEEQFEEVQDYLDSLRNRLELSRGENHFDMLARFFAYAPDAVLHKATRTLRRRSLHDQGLPADDEDTIAQVGLLQGIILEKLGNGVHGGERIVRCRGEYLEWKKQSSFQRGGKSINRKDIVKISTVDKDPSGCVFRISVVKSGTVLFRTITEQACQQCVRALCIWRCEGPPLSLRPMSATLPRIQSLYPTHTPEDEESNLNEASLASFASLHSEDTDLSTARPRSMPHFQHRQPPPPPPRPRPVVMLDSPMSSTTTSSPPQQQGPFASLRSKFRVKKPRGDAFVATAPKSTIPDGLPRSPRIATNHRHGPNASEIL